MVLLTPFSQGTHLLSVGRLIVVGDQAYHRCVISKFDDDIGLLRLIFLGFLLNRKKNSIYLKKMYLVKLCLLMSFLINVIHPC